MALAAAAGTKMDTIDLHDALLLACAPVKHHCYADITDGHAAAGVLDGRALRADGRDLQVLIVSPVFEGCTVLERQRLVNAVLDPHIKSGRVHSVQMRCWTPEQWEHQGRPTDLGKPCTFTSDPDPSLEGQGPGLVLPSCTAGGLGDGTLPPDAEVSREPSSAIPSPHKVAPQPDQPQREAAPTRPALTMEMILEHLREKSHTDALGGLHIRTRTTRTNSRARGARS